MTDPIALGVSSLALALSGLTAWLTLFRKGTVQMTQPTVIFMGPETALSRDALGTPKVFLRTLLFATSKRGRIIQSLHVALQRSETRQIFSVWVYGDEKLRRGSGLFVGETGVEANHHFITHSNGPAFQFLAGRYRLEVFARTLGDHAPKRLFTQDLDISPEVAKRSEKSGNGVYFDWAPELGEYVPHIEGPRGPLTSDVGSSSGGGAEALPSDTAT